ncbi:hypothetical protein [Auraticoccus monumenti]|uniref:Uncharacterized protein n=1 Tax=Auraticoccus monumenti TaxID=675864 RepID=A0A1G6S1L3_9ACTN|nr:hypothetical protein [Auraticoccus monumenti]SDD10563.1 hypothetical protein SAMN04489747_0187 [Auraticoccus monumenti]
MAEDDPGERELLDSYPPPSLPPRRRVVVVLVGALVVLLVVAVLVAQDRGRPSPRPDPSASAESPAPVPASPADPRPVTLRDGPPIVAGVPDSYVVHALGRDGVYRLDLGSGRVVLTPTPAGASGGGGVDLVAVPGAVVSDDTATVGSGTRFLYPEGRPARDLADPLRAAGQLLPAPGGRLWALTRRGAETAVVLHTVSGEVVDEVRVPGSVQPALDGELLLTHLGRTWRIGADLEPVLLVDGAVAAVGADRLLVEECDDDLRCRQLVTDRDGEGGVVLREEPGHGGGLGGSISPDHRWLAETVVRDESTLVSRLVDLRTGEPVADIPALTTGAARTAGTGAPWLPDSSALLALESGLLVAVDPATGETTPLDVALPALETFVVVQ